MKDLSRLNDVLDNDFDEPKTVPTTDGWDKCHLPVVAIFDGQWLKVETKTMPECIVWDLAGIRAMHVVVPVAAENRPEDRAGVPEIDDTMCPICNDPDCDHADISEFVHPEPGDADYVDIKDEPIKTTVDEDFESLSRHLGKAYSLFAVANRSCAFHREINGSPNPPFECSNHTNRSPSCRFTRCPRISH